MFLVQFLSGQEYGPMSKRLLKFVSGNNSHLRWEATVPSTLTIGWIMGGSPQRSSKETKHTKPSGRRLIEAIFKTCARCWIILSWESKGPTPPNANPPPTEIRPYSGIINHWFPLIRPY